MKLIILTIPGIGSKKPTYSQPLYDDLLARFYGTPLYDKFKIVEALPFFRTEMDQHQDELMARLGEHNHLGGVLSLRKFVLEAFGDGVTYEYNAQAPDSNYRKAHLHLKERIEYANNLLLEHPGAQLVIVASSLGAHILSNYIYDAQKGNIGIFTDEAPTAKNNLENLAYLATIGCNIPLFISGLPKEKIVPIRKPTHPLFRWDNFYDKDDVLGWPLKYINEAYQKLVTDHEVNTGAYVGSHVRYWDDNEFTKPFARRCLEITGG